MSGRSCRGGLSLSTKAGSTCNAADGKLANSWVNYAYEAEHLAPLPIVSDNQWHHLTVTINRDELDGRRWYVDGVEVGQGFNPTTKQSSLSTHIPLTIGRRSDSSGAGFQGNIGDIRLYKGAISAFEVRTIYQSVQLPPSNAIADPVTLPQKSVIYYRGVVLPKRYLFLHPQQWQPHWILENCYYYDLRCAGEETQQPLTSP